MSKKAKASCPVLAELEKAHKAKLATEKSDILRALSTHSAYSAHMVATLIRLGFQATPPSSSDALDAINERRVRLGMSPIAPVIPLYRAVPTQVEEQSTQEEEPSASSCATHAPPAASTAVVDLVSADEVPPLQLPLLLLSKSERPRASPLQHTTTNPY